MGKHVVVIGELNSGKTDFINAVSAIKIGSEYAFQYDESIKRIIDASFGATLVDNEDVFLFEPHLNLRQNVNWISEETSAVIILFDSMNWQPQLMGAAHTFKRLILERISRFDTPYVIVANKQDRADAISPDALHALLNLDENTPLFIRAVQRIETVLCTSCGSLLD